MSCQTKKVRRQRYVTTQFSLNAVYSLCQIQITTNTEKSTGNVVYLDLIGLAS
jgi:hypothetical protein